MKRLTLPIACLALIAVAGSANAVNLVPGGFVLTSGSPWLAGPFAGATLVVDNSPGETITAVNGLDTRFTGTLYASVWRETGGTLDFFYQFFNNENSADAIEAITVTNFGGFATDVGFLNNAGGTQDPTYAQRSPDGETVSFGFTPSPLGAGTIAPGEANMWLFIRTDAKFYTEGTTSVIDGGVAHAQTWSPAVPEPASMLALGVGLVGLVRRRRNSKS